MLGPLNAVKRNVPRPPPSLCLRRVSAACNPMSAKDAHEGTCVWPQLVHGHSCQRGHEHDEDDDSETAEPDERSHAITP
jgi:hypothetical protein